MATHDIFISYRRADAAYVTDYVNEQLSEQFGDGAIFHDTESIPLGVDFRTYLDQRVANCRIFLAVIGKRWLNAKDADGDLRLFDSADYVRIEIESALKRDIPVIPLLVDGAQMPVAEDLPDSLKELAFRNATPIRPAPDFHTDMDRLIDALQQHLESLGKDAPKKEWQTDTVEKSSTAKATRVGEAGQKKSLVRTGFMGALLVLVATAGWYYYQSRDVQYVRILDSPGSILAGELAFNPTGDILASTWTDIRLWDVPNGVLLHTIEIGTQNHALAFSTDGVQLASGGEDGIVRLWNATTGERLRRLSGHRRAVTTIAFAPQESILASGSKDQTVKLWNTTNGEPLHTLAEHQSSIHSVAFSLDGTMVASGSADGTARIWDVASGKSLLTVEHATEVGVSLVAFADDGRTLASCANDRSLKLWEVGSGKLLNTHKIGHSALAFSRDGRILATEDNKTPNDKSVRLNAGGILQFWEVTNGRLLSTLIDDANILATEISPDGNQLATAVTSKTLRVWDVRANKLW